MSLEISSLQQLLAHDGETAMGETVSLLLRQLSQHYQLPLRDMELRLLLVVISEMLAVTPHDETESNPEMFQNRLVERHDRMKTFLDEISELMTELKDQTRQMKEHHLRLSRLVLQWTARIKTTM